MSWTVQHTTDCLEQDYLRNRLGLSTTQPTESSWTVNHTTYRIVLDCQPHNLQNRHGLSTTQPTESSWTVNHTTRLSRPRLFTESYWTVNHTTYRIVMDCQPHNRQNRLGLSTTQPTESSWTVNHTTRLSRSTSSTECLGLSNTQQDCLDQHHLQNPLGLSNTQQDCLDQHHLQNVLDCPTHNQIV